MKSNLESHSHLKLKRYNTPFNSLIGAYYIDEFICDDLIKFFKNNWDKAGPGLFNINGKGVVDKLTKDSVELGISHENFNTPFGEYRRSLQKCLDTYINTYDEARACAHYNVNTFYNLQYYPPGGGFKTWHHESSSRDTAYRKLVFMTYLNTAPKAGTRFKYQDLTTPCKKGLTVIWPAEFTHTHKGVISKTKEKYIITGWFTYD
tara:strand:- start:644 stop:1258 length:615 start_codon:yes stop_codon:yes gene_type:complete